MCNKQTNQQTDLADQWITKQAAIDALTEVESHYEFDDHDHLISWAKTKIFALPSAQTTQNNTPNALETLDCVDRQEAIAFVDCGYLRPPTELAWSDKDVVDMLKRLPSAQPQHEVRFSDEDHVWIDGKQYISLRRFMEAVKDARKEAYNHGKSKGIKKGLAMAQRWIPVTERLPEDIRPVIVTWCNTDPASYYQHIVGKRFTGVAHYKSGKWYWYSSTTEDFLAEYGRYDVEEFDEAIEVIAWCELPDPWKGEEE